MKILGGLSDGELKKMMQNRTIKITIEGLGEFQGWAQSWTVNEELDQTRFLDEPCTIFKRPNPYRRTCDIEFSPLTRINTNKE